VLLALLLDIKIFPIVTGILASVSQSTGLRATDGRVIIRQSVTKG
jgi:hypothetical protein